ncbi:TIGR02444 family protein [Aestuariibacter sp. AA17]|uniref:TIGR02444 family protein n=1 Tax=Fluctibacter corallii TaxID=2984329 RepID=A0ABT3AC17_9ALTE|nr:TIGR02444 family protein [Aestuariibacter sp. AA17]MCV2885817.1 TIGR02444 family protein [Aestuariibacter sp. AA17]
MHDLTANSFWQFSLRFYGQENIEKTCITLQEQYGFNVNILLLCRFLEEFSLTLNSEQVGSLMQSISESETSLRAFRLRRKQAKGTKKYEVLLQQELEIEKVQQSALIRHVSDLDLTCSLFPNVASYATYKAIDLNKVTALVPLLNALSRYDLATFIYNSNDKI